MDLRLPLPLSLSLALSASVAGCSGEGADGGPSCGDGHVDAGEACDDGAANGQAGECSADCSRVTGSATVSGIAAPFNNAVEGRIEGATVSVLEHPDLSTVTGADGRFSFEGLVAGEEVTLVMEHPDYPLIQTGSHVVPAEGIDDLTFQAPTKAIYDLLAGVVMITPDDAMCQLVTTITRKGGTILEPGAHGEAGVTVTSEPALPAEHGPVYFNSSVIPDRTLTESSDDGGVLFTNVPPGEYVWSGHKAGAELADVKLKCRAGVLVNASPPRGMNVL